MKRSRKMNSSDTLSLQGHRLLQIGVALFLFSSLQGFAVPHFAVPSLGRSVHTLSAFSGIILLTLGLLWPRLNLGAAASRIAFWLALSPWHSYWWPERRVDCAREDNSAI